MRWRGRVRLSKVNTALLVFGLAVLIAAVAGPRATIDGSSVGPGASWWQLALVVAVGVGAVGWAVLSSRELVPVLWAGGGFVGAPPRLPARLLERTDLLAKVVAALRTRDGVVALIGIGGAGKSTLAAQACLQRRVQREYRDGVTWLEAGPGQDPVALLAVLARRAGAGAGDAAGRITTVGEGLDVLAAALRGKRMLVVVDNVWEHSPLDALIKLPSTCTVLFTSRLPALATTVRATTIGVDEPTRRWNCWAYGQGRPQPICQTLRGRCVPGRGTWRWAWQWPGR